MKWSGILVLLFVNLVFSIGPQHCIFDSRSTQGNQWRGTSSIISEHYDITVMPSYLDVNLDLAFDCSGAVAPDSFTDALEIVGNMNIAQDAAVTGMLLWNGDEILKAKLKPLQLAREQYEEVVDRDAEAPPPPRDPVIFEYGWGEDNYYLSIFPVKWQGSRKLRMRYVIPAINMNGHTDIPFPTAFNQTLATYTITAGAGVTAAATVNHGGTPVALELPTRFTTSDSVYRTTVMIRPSVNNDQRSKFYTSSLQLPDFKGSLTHVIGKSGAEVISSAKLSEDIVFLWRWNHFDCVHLYRKQIVEQAKLLRTFMEKIAGSSKRAGLIVDRSGGEKRVFAIDSTGGASGKRMLQFLDSLCELSFSKSGKWFQPDFSPRETDSILALSMEEFRGALRHAESLFDFKRTNCLCRIIVMTAGPCWIQNSRVITPEVDSTILITPVSSLSGTELLAGLSVPTEAEQFYWPGVHQGSVQHNSSAMAVEAVLSTASGTTLTVPVPVQNPAYRYYWNTVSPHLDRKLHSTEPLRPEIRWKIYNHSSLIAEVTEIPEIVQQSDPIQFASSVCGSGALTSLDEEPTTSLAATFGFVDKSYALLALEEDVMEPLDQERYRLAGVPALTDVDITRQPDTTVPPEQVLDNQSTTAARETPVNNNKNAANILKLVLRQSELTITLPENSAMIPSTTASLTIYTLAGKQLFRLDDVAIINGTIRCTLPMAVAASRQTLIVRVRIGGKIFTLRTVGNEKQVMYGRMK